MREVAARHVTEPTLLEQGERFRTTLAGIGDAVVATDVDTRVTCMNAVAEALTGGTAANARDDRLDAVFRIVHETTRSVDERAVVRAPQDGDIVVPATHAVLIARHGTERPIDGSAASIRRTDGQVVGCVLVFLDIGERHRLQADRREAQDEVDVTLERITNAVTRFDRDWRMVGVHAQPERTGQRSGTRGTR